MGNIATAISRRPAALSGQHDVLVVGDDAAEVRQLAAQVVAPSQLLLGGRRQVGQHEDALVDEDGDDVFDDADELEVGGLQFGADFGEIGRASSRARVCQYV